MTNREYYKSLTEEEKIVEILIYLDSIHMILTNIFTEVKFELNK